MYGPPDCSSSEDEYFADDPEYELYKEKAKKITLHNMNNVYDNNGNNSLTDMYYAINNGKTNEVLKLLDSGIDINVELQDGWNPLLLAVSLGKSEIVRELIKRNANINSTKDGLTALMLACNCSSELAPFEDSLDVTQVLVENGINVDQIDRRRRTAIMFAAYNGHLDAVKFLLPICDRNVEDNQRWTALFWAVYGNHPEITKFLLDEGFSTEKRDVREYTALEIAKEFELLDVQKVFPEELSDTDYVLLESHKHNFEDTFCNLKENNTPQFFLDICNLLYGTRNQSLIKLFNEKDVSLKEFLALSDTELKDMGILLPFQRNRILTGLYRFHKHAFFTKSLPIVQGDEIYCNIDVSKAVITAIKQLIAMEASLSFILKNIQKPLSKEDEIEISQMIKNLKRKTRTLKIVTSKLLNNSQYWDSINKPADLITKSSKRRRIPWRKCIFTFGIASIVLMKLILR